jgi:Flp pilus assembly protein TadB
MPVVLYLAISLSTAAFVISVFSFFFFRAYLRRRTAQERILSELREEVDMIVRKIEHATDRDISLVKEREQGLKSLLAEVDKRLQLYIRELEKRREDENVHASITAKARAVTYQE